MTLEAPTLLDVVLKLAGALLLGVPLGLAQERTSRTTGLRTYPLLIAGVCGFLLLGLRTAGGVSEQADYFYGVLTGIGFVGAGAILKSREDVRGLGTAVSLWLCGAIGAGVAYGAHLAAGTLSLMCALALWAAGRRKEAQTP